MLLVPSPIAKSAFVNEGEGLRFVSHTAYDAQTKGMLTLRKYSVRIALGELLIPRSGKEAGKCILIGLALAKNGKNRSQFLKSVRKVQASLPGRGRDSIFQFPRR